MNNREWQCSTLPFTASAWLKPLLRGLLGVTLVASTAAVAQGFRPPENVNPGQSATPTLDSSYEQEAWLVYTYEIEKDGSVQNMKIHTSNGVPEVENKILGHVNAMRFTPASRDGKPVKVAVGPIVYTWILDTPREMSEGFSATYQEAWDYFKQEDYDRAFEAAVTLKTLPGRNAYEEVKFQILGASLASRWDDDTAELGHLQRIVEFQSLADRNRFTNPYVEDGQYLMILERIHSLQLGKMMLADGELTLNKMMARDGNSEVTARARAAHQDAEGRFRANPDVTIDGELTPIYREGQGMWETGLTRKDFSLTDVKGRIESVHLACQGGGDKRLRYPSSSTWTIPAGWRDCKIEVAGRSGTRFTVHQMIPKSPSLQ
jgi:TonB-like protein